MGRVRAPIRVLFGIALLFLGAGAVLVALAFGGRPQAQLLGGNVAINAGAGDLREISSHNSPTVVRSPVDPSRLAIANRIDTPRFSCALHVSSDGAATWSQVPIPVPRGEEPKCYAPEVAFGADGTLYLAFVTLASRGNVPHAVWLSSSKDGGRTLSTPRRTLGPLSFQVRLVADPTVAGRLYLTWLHASDVGLYRFTEPGNPIRFARSDDGGRSWARPVTVSDRSRERVVAPSLAVGAGRELSVLYLDLGEDRLDYEGGHEGQGGAPYPGPWRLVLARSVDGGAHWSESVVEPRLRPTERFLAFLPPFPALAVDRERGRMFAAFEDGRLGDADVWVWASEDGGESWGDAQRVNDTPEGDGSTQYRPKLSVARDGRLDVLYYDRRADAEDLRNEASLQSSFDGGASFGPRLRLSERPFDSRVGFGSERGMPDIGSRLGLLSDDRHAFAVWTDTAAGTRTSGKQDLAGSVVGFPEPAISELARVALGIGGVALCLAGLGVLAMGRIVSARERRVDGAHATTSA